MRPSDPVPALIQPVREEEGEAWETYIHRIARLDRQETAAVLEMGDLLVEMEEKFGKENLKTVAESTMVSWSAIQERARVSRRIPRDSPIRQIPWLSFSHLRAIAWTTRPEHWAKVAESEGLSTRELIERITRAGDQEAVERGEPCGQCDGSIGDGPTIVAVTIGRERRVRLCSTACAVAFIQEHAQNRDPFARPAAGDEWRRADVFDPFARSIQDLDAED